MLFAWLLIWPNVLLPNCELAIAAHCTILNRFSTSMFSDADVPAPVRTFLRIPRSTLFRHGEYTPGRMRGVSANRLTGVVANAFLFRYRLSSTLAVIRSVMSPGTRKSWPGTIVGRR